MNFPLSSQDEWYFSASYASPVTSPSESTQEVSYPPGDPSSSSRHYYEPVETFYDDTNTMAPHFHTNEPPTMVFEAPAYNASADTRGGQPTHSPAYIPSNDARSLSTNAPIVAAAPTALNVAPFAPTTQVTTQRRIRCAICPKTFDRISRADACHSRHLGKKPNVCQGACGNTACDAAYGSVENLQRHIRPLAERKVACPHWYNFHRWCALMLI